MTRVRTSTPRNFTGSEIGREIVRATEAIPANHEIVTFSAGENMPIVCCFIPEMSADFDSYGQDFPEYAWNGEKWVKIGVL